LALKCFPPSVNTYSRDAILCTKWTDFNATCRLSCEWALLKTFSRSEVRGQGHDQTS